jgi:hypothetical protein
MVRRYSLMQAHVRMGVSSLIMGNCLFLNRPRTCLSLSAAVASSLSIVSQMLAIVPRISLSSCDLAMSSLYTDGSAVYYG